MRASMGVKPGVRWSTVDTFLIGVVTALAGALRFAGITRPGNFVFDEHYAADACLFVLGLEGNCSTTVEIGGVHPPLGKWLIGAGIRLFGFTPAGWRLAPLIAGTLSVALLYLLARRLLGSTGAALLAASLFAFDFLHFVMSRTAMLDAFVVLFGLASFICLVYDGDRSEATRPTRNARGPRVLRRPWLVGAGIAGGAALACKWSGGYLLAGVAVLACMSAAARAHGGPRRYLRAAREEGVALLTALVLIPVAIYVLSYTGRLDGALFVWPWTEGSWIQSFFARQHFMVEHHTGALYVHPYTSPAWSWPFIKRPVLFYFRDLGGGNYQEILALGNPLLWWPALLALAAIVWRALRRRSVRSPDTVIIAGVAAGYMPWLLITREEAFLYYFLPAVPFLYLGLAHLVGGMAWRPVRAAASGSLAVASIAMFVFFRPILVGNTVTHHQWERRMFFSDCGPPISNSHQGPVTRQVPPPQGWCWM